MAKDSYKISKDIHDIYHRHRQHFEKLENMLDELSQAAEVTHEEILGMIKGKHKLKAVPLSIFSTWLAPLEALVVYMKEYLKLSFAEISRELNRDQRTIWLTYRNAKKKNIQLSVKDDYFVPLEIFADRTLSILENLAKHLHEAKGHPFREIAKLLNKDNRTIWTVYSRASKKKSRRPK